MRERYHPQNCESFFFFFLHFFFLDEQKLALNRTIAPPLHMLVYIAHPTDSSCAYLLPFTSPPYPPLLSSSTPIGFFFSLI